MPRHQLIDAGCRPAADELGQRVSEPSVRIAAIELASFKHRSDARPIFGPIIAAGEECILSIMQSFA